MSEPLNASQVAAPTQMPLSARARDGNPQQTDYTTNCPNQQTGKRPPV